MHLFSIRRPLTAKTAILLLLATVLAVGLWVWLPSIFFAPELRGRLVTPDGRPVQGAIVVAGWKVRTMYFNNTMGQLELRETVSAPDGQFTIAAWGPRLLWKGALMEDQPVVRIFKPGFLPLIVSNKEGVPMRSSPTIIRFRLQDQTVILQPFDGTPAAYAGKFEPLMSSMDEFVRFDGPECDPHRRPRGLARAPAAL